VELDTDYCKQAASRRMNENTLFGNAKLQIELKPHLNKNPSPPRSGRGTEGEVSLASALLETSPAYKPRARRKSFRARK